MTDLVGRGEAEFLIYQAEDERTRIEVRFDGDTLCAGWGLVPLVLAGDQLGNELQAPMAVVILVGLVSSTARNMRTTSTSRLCGDVRDASIV